MRGWSLGSMVAMAALGWSAAHADVCGAQTHTRYEETRAYFGDTLGACRPDGSCSAVIARVGEDDATAFARQLRVARAEAGADYSVELAATEPMPRENPWPMALQFARSRMTFESGEALSLNEFRVASGAEAAPVVKALKGAAEVRWLYTSEQGEASEPFPLRGLTAALTWIDCMQAR